MSNKVRLTTLMLGLAVSGFTQSEPPQGVEPSQGGDPPSRVARLSYQSGQVSFRAGTVDDWSAASLNYPLTSGDHLWADAGAQVEMHIGANAVRMSSQTALSFLNLDDRTVQISLTQGSLQIHLRSLDPDETFEVDTPNAAVTLLRPGDYRVDADGDNNLTALTVRGGDASVTAAADAFTVHARETVQIRGLDAVSHDIAGAMAMNDFERWCDTRDRREDESPSAEFVSRDMTGYEDLDTYGSWREDRDYGRVWAPRTAAADWAPYRYGHWAWVEPWGWTWIDDAPWGFAPFHYGRWAYAGASWVWIPGRRVVGVRPVYAPALVVFVGGAGAGAAWFPLGPGEVYRPAYRVSPVYVRNVNGRYVTNVAVINNGNVADVRYVNRRAGGVTVATTEVFSGGRHIGAEAARVDMREIDRGRVAGFAAPIAPRRESVVFGRGAAPPARVVERTVVVRSTPPPPPVSFGARQRALESNQGRPLDPSQVESLRRGEPARNPMVRTAQPGRPEEPRRFGRSPASAQEPAAQPATPAARPNSGNRDEMRNDRPGRTPGSVQTPSATPAVQPSRNVEPPRQTETPRQVETPRRVERPQQQTRPAEEQRRIEPRSAEQPRPEPRTESRQQRKEERKTGRKEEKKDNK